MLNACKMCILNLEISGNGSCYEEFRGLVSQYQSIVLRRSKPNPPNVPPLVHTHNCTSMENAKIIFCIQNQPQKKFNILFVICHIIREKQKGYKNIDQITPSILYEQPYNCCWPFI